MIDVRLTGRAMHAFFVEPIYNLANTILLEQNGEWKGRAGTAREHRNVPKFQ